LLITLCLAASATASLAADTPAPDPDAAGSSPIFDYEVHPPGSYTLYAIKRASDGKVLDTDGRSRRLTDFFGHGKVTLLSFIYSGCADPSGCPYAYSVFHQIQNRLEREQPGVADKVRLVSLSFDPTHDTPDMLKLYAGENSRVSSGVRWHFLTTRSLHDLIPILDEYGQDVYLDLDPKTGQSLGSMSHVLKVFLIDRHDEIREIYSSSFLQPEVAYNDILTLLLEDGATLQ